MSRKPFPADDDECPSCGGYGYFNADGNPTIDKSWEGRGGRKCLDCRGTGTRAPTEAEVYEHATQQASVDAMAERHTRLVQALCDDLGYGFVIQQATELWKKKDPVGAIDEKIEGRREECKMWETLLETWIAGARARKPTRGAYDAKVLTEVLEHFRTQKKNGSIS